MRILLLGYALSSLLSTTDATIQQSLHINIDGLFQNSIDPSTFQNKILKYSDENVSSDFFMLVPARLNGNMSNSSQVFDKKKYGTVEDTNQMLYLKEKWSPLEQGTVKPKFIASKKVNDTLLSWSRFRLDQTDSPAEIAPTVCLAISYWYNSTAKLVTERAVEVATALQMSCQAPDMIALTFSGDFPPQIVEYFTGGYEINGNKSSLIFQNPSQTAPDDLEDDHVHVSEELSGHMLLHLKEGMCIGDFYAQDSAMKEEAMTVELCQGVDCVATCGLRASDLLPGSNDTSLPEDNTELESKSRQGVIMIISCGTFLLGCGLLFYYFFRKKFFINENEDAKQDKELVDNLAYVLRV